MQGKDVAELYSSSLCGWLVVFLVGFFGFFLVWVFLFFVVYFFPRWMEFPGLVFPVLDAIAPKLPWQGEGSLLPPNLFPTTTQFSGALCIQLTSRGHKHTWICHTQVISTWQNSLGMNTFLLPVLLNQGTFFLQGLCVLVWAILVFSSPKIISTGRNTVFFIPAVFLVTVTISWQYVCILGQNQITCWKCLSPLQFLQHYSQASYIRSIIWKRHNRGYIKFYTELPSNCMQ